MRSLARDHTMTPANILIADDDVELTQLLGDFLQLEGLNVTAVHDGDAGARAALTGQFDLLVLDVMLPRMQGLQVLKEVRKKSTMPIIMLTARGDDTDRILGLELGADDYLPKPCNPQELVARIKAVLRRSQIPTKPTNRHFKIAGIELDSATRRCTYKDQDVHLTSTEFDILALLLEMAGSVVDKNTISEQVLKRRLMPYDRSIDVHISNIRKKIHEHENSEEFIKNIRGVGYQFVLDTGNQEISG
jgi:DNA-binding response OmpR family regulator